MCKGHGRKPRAPEVSTFPYRGSPGLLVWGARLRPILSSPPALAMNILFAARICVGTGAGIGCFGCAVRKEPCNNIATVKQKAAALRLFVVFPPWAISHGVEAPLLRPQFRVW
jgi:hypothetical protein